LLNFFKEAEKHERLKVLSAECMVWCLFPLSVLAFTGKGPICMARKENIRMI